MGGFENEEKEHPELLELESHGMPECKEKLARLIVNKAGTIDNDNSRLEAMLWIQRVTE